MKRNREPLIDKPIDSTRIRKSLVGNKKDKNIIELTWH